MPCVRFPTYLIKCFTINLLIHIREKPKRLVKEEILRIDLHLFYHRRHDAALLSHIHFEEECAFLKSKCYLADNNKYVCMRSDGCNENFKYTLSFCKNKNSMWY